MITLDHVNAVCLQVNMLLSKNFEYTGYNSSGEFFFLYKKLNVKFKISSPNHKGHYGKYRLELVDIPKHDKIFTSNSFRYRWYFLTINGDKLKEPIAHVSYDKGYKVLLREIQQRFIGEVNKIYKGMEDYARQDKINKAKEEELNKLRGLNWSSCRSNWSKYYDK
jgi:hypothetical protein